MGKRLTWIPNVAKLAIMPAAATIALACFTYTALFAVPPSLHLVILRMNVLLLPVLHAVKHRHRWKLGMLAAVLLLGSVYCFYSGPPTSIGIGIVFSLLSLAAYMLYSTVIERTLHDNHIGLRYPYLLHATGLLLGLFGLVLLPFTEWQSLSWIIIACIALYAIACVFIPHACYYVLLNERQSKRAGDLFFAEAPIAGVAEVLLLGLILPTHLYLLMGCALIAIFVLRWHKRTRLFA